MPDERRVGARFQVELKIVFGSELRFGGGQTMNLSEGGVFIRTTELKPVGTKIDLAFRLPPPLPPVWARGEVRWIGEAGNGSILGMGVQFRLISEYSLENIREVLAKGRVDVA